MNREEIVERLRRVGPRLDQEYGVSLIVLFGSVASGHSNIGMRLSSDVDIAIYLSTVNDERQKRGRHGSALDDYLFNNKLLLVGEFTDLLRIDSVDVVLINECPPALKYEIFTKGMLTYCRDEREYEDQYLAAIREYFDIQPLLKEQFEEAQEYLSSKGSAGNSSW